MIRKVSGSLNSIHIYINDYCDSSVANVFGEWAVNWVDPIEKSVTS